MTRSLFVGLAAGVSLFSMLASGARAELVVTVGGDGVVKLWNTEKPEEPGKVLVSGLKEGVGASAVSADGKLLAIGGADKTVRLFSLPAGEKKAEIVAHAGAVSSLGFSPDGKSLYTASGDGAVKLWSIATGKAQVTIAGAHTGGVKGLAAVDSMTLTVGADDNLTIWDEAGSQQMSIPAGHSGGVRGFLAAPKEQRGFTFGGEGLIRSWTMEGPVDFDDDKKSAINALAISPDGKLLVAALADGSVKVFDTAKNAKIATVADAHKDGVVSISFAGGGKAIVTGGADKSVKVWGLDGKLMKEIKDAHDGKVLSILVVPAEKKAEAK